MNAAQIIDALGGTAEVAYELGVGLSAASNYKARGFPRSRLFDLHQIAQRKAPDITLAILHEAAAPARRGASAAGPSSQEAA